MVSPLGFQLGGCSGKGCRRGRGHRELSQASGEEGGTWTLKTGGRTQIAGLRARGKLRWLELKVNEGRWWCGGWGGGWGRGGGGGQVKSVAVDHPRSDPKLGDGHTALSSLLCRLSIFHKEGKNMPSFQNALCSCLGKG